MALSCSLPYFGRLQSEVTYVYRGRGTRVVSTMCMIRRVKSGILDNESKKSECHSHANIGNYVSGSTINYATFMVLTSNILNLKIVKTRNTRQLAKGDETCGYVSVRVSVCMCMCVCVPCVWALSRSRRGRWQFRSRQCSYLRWGIRCAPNGREGGGVTDMLQMFYDTNKALDAVLMVMTTPHKKTIIIST